MHACLCISLYIYTYIDRSILIHMSCLLRDEGTGNLQPRHLSVAMLCAAFLLKACGSAVRALRWFDLFVLLLQLYADPLLASRERMALV